MGIATGDLVDLGMSPAQALMTSSLGSARLLGVELEPDPVRAGVTSPSASRNRIFEIVMSGNSAFTDTRTSPIDW